MNAALEPHRPVLLVVDDDEVNREVAMGLGRSLGFEVSSVEDGDKAVEACLVQPPDLVLMDIDLPGMDGVTTTSRLKRLHLEGRLPDLPVIAATALSDPDTRQRCIGVGMEGFLTKPLMRDDLKRACEWVLAKGSFAAWLKGLSARLRSVLDHRVRLECSAPPDCPWPVCDPSGLEAAITEMTRRVLGTMAPDGEISWTAMGWPSRAAPGAHGWFVVSVSTPEPANVDHEFETLRQNSDLMRLVGCAGGTISSGSGGPGSAYGIVLALPSVPLRSVRIPSRSQGAMRPSLMA